MVAAMANVFCGFFNEGGARRTGSFEPWFWIGAAVLFTPIAKVPVLNGIVNGSTTDICGAASKMVVVVFLVTVDADGAIRGALTLSRLVVCALAIMAFFDTGFTLSSLFELASFLELLCAGVVAEVTSAALRFMRS